MGSGDVASRETTPRSALASPIIMVRTVGEPPSIAADELIARDRLIKTPTHRQRDPNAEWQKYYSDGRRR